MTSMVTGISFLVMAVSGVILYIAPRGRYANWTEWSMVGLEKDQWAALHMTSAVLLLLAVAFHLWFNWRPLCNYVRRRGAAARPRLRELVLAVVVCAVVVAGTLVDVPLLRNVAELNESIKDHWERGEVVAPGFGAQSGRLAGAETEARTPGISGGDRSSIDPQARESGRGGFGRMSLAALCREEGLDLEGTITWLRESGIECDGSTTVRELATAMNATPRETAARLRSAP